MSANTTASNNTAASGYNTLLANTTGTENTAVGANALDANTTAAANTAIGYQSLTTNTSGNNSSTNAGIGEHYSKVTTAKHREFAIEKL